MKPHDIHYLKSGHPSIVAWVYPDMQIRCLYQSQSGTTRTVLTGFRPTENVSWREYWKGTAIPLAESRITGPYPIDSLVRYEDEVYVVLGYFRRFMVMGHFDTGALCIVRKGHKSIHRHLLI
jgi:hypothetical protein